MMNGDRFHGTVKLSVALFLTVFSGRLAAAQENYWVPKEPPKSRYTVDVTIDPEKKLVHGVEAIAFRNDSRRPIFTLAFDWYDNSIRSTNVGYENKYLKHLYYSFILFFPTRSFIARLFHTAGPGTTWTVCSIESGV
jgi:hypothetical protein